ncbi:MAG: cytochrome c [Acidimicrobiales bacterium]
MQSPIVRRIIPNLLVFGLVGLGLASCARAASPELPAGADAELVAGQNLYGRNCASCHGGDGSGALGPKFSGGHLVEKYPDPADQLAVIEEGRSAMPAFGERLTDEELAAIVRYTREILSPLE